MQDTPWGILLYGRDAASVFYSPSRLGHKVTKGFCPVDGGCRIHRLLLCGEVRPSPERLCCIWNQKIWWWVSCDAEALGNAEPLHCHCSQVHSDPEWYHMIGRSIYGLYRTNCILMVNWIVWIRTVWLKLNSLNGNAFDNWTVLTFKQRAYGNLNCLK